MIQSVAPTISENSLGQPSVLYKYRDYSDAFHRRVLTHREVYFPSFSQFNDPYEGWVPYRYDPSELTPDNIFMRYRDEVMREHPDWTEQQVQAECYEYQRRGYFHDPQHMEKIQAKTRDELENIYGILCLTTDPCNYLMWSHYAKSHTGFCVGFNTEVLFHFVGGWLQPVSYTDKVPYLSLTKSTIEFITHLASTKGIIWEYENEFRMGKSEYRRKTLVAPSEALHSVIWGCRFDEQEKMRLTEIILREHPHVKIFNCELSKDTFGCQINQVA